ncbi:hypothetical protein F5Y16DRAFT_71135 [Xylariaceae sp. FL0255]|nr:hypothetical protein F5Y16DRAFT_71135 [Xylariaceae sp. FL0255]
MAEKAAQKAAQALGESLTKHLKAGKEDAIICCKGKEFKVHALVLSLQSDFFQKAFNGPWKESQGDKRIYLEDDVEVVKAMISFMYSFKYDIPTGVSNPMFHAQVYGVANKYLIPQMQNYSKDSFKDSTGTLCYGLSVPDDLHMVIKEVYTSTPDSDRGLRELVLKACQENLKKLSGKKSFRLTLDTVSGFAGDLVLISPQAERCRDCKARFYADEYDTEGYCHFCFYEAGDDDENYDEDGYDVDGYDRDGYDRSDLDRYGRY